MVVGVHRILPARRHMLPPQAGRVDHFDIVLQQSEKRPGLARPEVGFRADAILQLPGMHQHVVSDWHEDEIDAAFGELVAECLETLDDRGLGCKALVFDEALDVADLEQAIGVNVALVFGDGLQLLVQLAPRGFRHLTFLPLAQYLQVGFNGFFSQGKLAFPRVCGSSAGCCHSE